MPPSRLQLAKYVFAEHYRLVKAKLGSVLLILIVFAEMAHACKWDARTLLEEKMERPTLAQAILFPTTEESDIKSLTEDLQKFKANPQTNDPAWWNNLAGSYLRLRACH